MGIDKAPSMIAMGMNSAMTAAMMIAVMSRTVFIRCFPFFEMS